MKKPRDDSRKRANYAARRCRRWRTDSRRAYSGAVREFCFLISSPAWLLGARFPAGRCSTIMTRGSEDFKKNPPLTRLVAISVARFAEPLLFHLVTMENRAGLTARPTLFLKSRIVRGRITGVDRLACDLGFG
ncbi:MAG TPA: hypothetical protein VM223_03155 [Planctomycetota bacterium]|nr:hypothetical protein [Planctomycetota bacterium]